MKTRPRETATERRDLMSETERAARDALATWIKAEMEYDKYSRDRYVPTWVAIDHANRQNELRLAGVRLIVEREGQ